VVGEEGRGDEGEGDEGEDEEMLDVRWGEGDWEGFWEGEEVATSDIIIKSGVREGDFEFNVFK
jgi:hypothetical protein